MPLASIKPILAVPCTLLLLAGCATPPGELPKQTVSVQTFEASQPIAGVSCELSNEHGQWTVVTPGSVEVIASAEDLAIICSKPDLADGQARAVARPSAGYLSNPIVNITMPAVAIIEPVKQFTVGITQVYPERIQVMMDQDIIVTATQ